MCEMRVVRLFDFFFCTVYLYFFYGCCFCAPVTKHHFIYMCIYTLFGFVHLDSLSSSYVVAYTGSRSVYYVYTKICLSVAAVLEVYVVSEGQLATRTSGIKKILFIYNINCRRESVIEFFLVSISARSIRSVRRRKCINTARY